MTFGRDDTASAARKRIMKVLDDGEPHDVGEVVDTVVDDTADPATACDVIAEMFRQGEVYEPQPGKMKKTSSGGRS